MLVGQLGLIGGFFVAITAVVGGRERAIGRLAATTGLGAQVPSDSAEPDRTGPASPASPQPTSPRPTTPPAVRRDLAARARSGHLQVADSFHGVRLTSRHHRLRHITDLSAEHRD